MNEIKCPKCGEFFQIDEAGYAEILKQVHDKEFEKELKQKRCEFDAEKNAAIEIEVAKAEATKDKEIFELKQQITTLEA